MQSPIGMTAVVLAAGVGSRLDPLTKQLPKPLIPFANFPVMEHILCLLKRHGITQTVSNVHYLPESVVSYFADGSRLGLHSTFVRESMLTGDAGGVRACREHLKDGSFLVIMGDLITDLDVGYVIRQHREKGALASIALKQVKDVERFGVAVIDPDSRIVEFQEKPSRETAKSNLASTGVYVFEPKIFDYIGDDAEVSFGHDVFPRLVKEKLPLLGVEVWGYWSDIGTISQYKNSTSDALHGLIDIELPGHQFHHGWIGDGSTIRGTSLVDGLVQIGRNTHIADDVTLKGFVVIGDNCLIERGTTVQNSIIWSSTVIGAGSNIADSVIGSRCHIRNGSQLVAAAVVEPTNRAAEISRTPAQLSDRWTNDALELAGTADQEFHTERESRGSH